MSLVEPFTKFGECTYSNITDDDDLQFSLIVVMLEIINKHDIITIDLCDIKLYNKGLWRLQ